MKANIIELLRQRVSDCPENLSVLVVIVEYTLDAVHIIPNSLSERIRAHISGVCEQEKVMRMNY